MSEAADRYTEEEITRLIEHGGYDEGRKHEYRRFYRAGIMKGIDSVKRAGTTGNPDAMDIKDDICEMLEQQFMDGIPLNTYLNSHRAHPTTPHAHPGTTVQE